MSPTFPLLRLPLLAFENVLQFVGFADILILSQCSKDLKRLVKPISRKQKHIKLSFWLIGFRNTVMLSDGGKRENFQWCFHRKNDVHITQTCGLEKREVDGKEWSVNKYKAAWSIMDPNSIDALLSFVTYLLTFFNFTNRHLNIRSCREDEFTTLLVNTTQFHKADSISIEIQNFLCSEIAHMLENFVTEDLRLTGKLEEYNSNFTWRNPICHEKIQISHSKWITFEIFMQMTGCCGQIQLYRSILTGRNLNEMVKLWLESGNSTLEMVYVAVCRSTDELLIWEDILQGLQYVQGAKKKDFGERYLKKENYENGYDIIRNDGVWATLTLRWNYVDSYFCFTVWQDPQPNL